ncbi:MAG: FecR family protein [Gammaproteobacteria bacterium]|nr:FecR family protein [Gammaproteobacteria bacterium]
MPARRYALSVLCLAALLGNTAAASGPVGTALTVKGVVTLQPQAGDAVFLAKDSKVHEGDTIVSAEKSFAVIAFIDDSRVVIRQETEFVVEGFRFDEAEQSSAFRLLKGGIRALTGKIARENPDNYKLDTPVASLGVRGTSYDARLCDETCSEESDTGSEWQAAPAQSECAIRLDIEKFPAGGYFTVREGAVVLRKEGREVTLRPGDVGFADDSRIGCLPQVPAFMFDDQTPLPESDDFRKFSPLMCTP